MITGALRGFFVVYFLVAACICTLGRLDHHTFAKSDFCQNHTSVRQSGRFGAEHCSYHLKNWESIEYWFKSYAEILFPDIFGPEIKFAAAFALVSLTKWLDVVVIGVAGFTACALARKGLLGARSVPLGNGNPKQFKH